MTQANQPAPDDAQPVPPQASPTGAPVDGALPQQPASTRAAPAAPRKKRKRRVPIWLKSVGVVVLLLLLFVAFAPTIASTGPVRSLVLGKVNAGLNGRVEVADWSLGWMSGIKLTGVRV